MKNLFFLLLALLSAPAFAQSRLSPPATPQQPVTDNYFGHAVVDNYRWLEDIHQPAAQAWYRGQADYASAVLARLPGRDSLLRTFVRYDALRPMSYGGIMRKGQRYFYRKTLPTDRVSKLYYRDLVAGTDQLGPEVLLFDPSAYEPAKKYALSGFLPSDDGQWLTVALAAGGAEISSMRVLEVATKAFAPESLHSLFGYSNYGWSPDGQGFIYGQLSGPDPQVPAAHLDNRVFYHRVGTDPHTDQELLSRAKYPALGLQAAQDPVVFYDEQRTALLGLLQTADSRWNGFIAPAADLRKPTIGWRRFVTLADSVYAVAQAQGQYFILSRRGSAKGRVLATPSLHPSVAQATVLLPASEWNIVDMSTSRDYLFVTLSNGISTRVRQYAVRTQQWQEVELPLRGTVSIQPLSPTSNDCLMRVTSWQQPSTLYAYQPATRHATLSMFDVPVRYPGLADLVTEEVEVPRPDGVRVPLSLIYRKGLKRDGQTICYLTGYGAYGVSEVPVFNSRYLALLSQGVMVAVAHVRGGGEKGEGWHLAGYKITKPNTWQDFIACGDYLIKQGYTSSAHLIGEGTSAGGILISRTITERPDLLAAAICNVADCNALRSEQGTDGPLNAAEYGTVQDSIECRALRAMDGLSHVRAGTPYPAVICVGGMNDPRVMVWQPGKFAAALQNASTSGKPVLLQVNYDNGHFTEDKQVTFRNFANMYAFALWQAEHPGFQPISPPPAGPSSTK